MYEEYDEAVEKGITILKKILNSVRGFYCFSGPCASFRKYLDAQQLPYSKELALIWLKENKLSWNHLKYKNSRRSMYQLNEIYTTGWLVYPFHYVYEDSPAYQQLEKWCKSVLNSYLDGEYFIIHPGMFQEQKTSISRFLFYCESIGVTAFIEITHGIIKRFQNEDIHKTTKSRNHYHMNIRHFLQFLQDEGITQYSLALTLDQFYAPNLIIINELEITSKEKFDEFQCTNESQYCENLKLYNLSVAKGISSFEEMKYSKTIRNVFKQSCREFTIFLEANHLVFSLELVDHWLELKYAQNCSGVPYWGRRRTLHTIAYIMKTGKFTIIPLLVLKESKYHLPVWCNELIKRYLSERKRNGMEKSTLCMDKNSCSRFLEFISSIGIESLETIRIQDIKDFHIQDEHSTVEGKNAYGCRIRGFLQYLSIEGLLPNSYSQALSCDAASQTQIIETLSAKEIDTITFHNKNPKSIMELRNNAMVTLGLRMGLRGIDVVRLKLNDISWEHQTISISQKKTGKPLLLPFPIEVGNCLYRYISEGRPKTKVEEVFVWHKVPFPALSRSACANALHKAIGFRDGKNGFHITRKTFASRMLVHETPTSIIAEALGHSSNENVDEYLETDSKKMRKCAISLSKIEFKGARL